MGLTVTTRNGQVLFKEVGAADYEELENLGIIDIGEEVPIGSHSDAGGTVPTVGNGTWKGPLSFGKTAHSIAFRAGKDYEFKVIPDITTLTNFWTFKAKVGNTPKQIGVNKKDENNASFVETELTVYGTPTPNGTLTLADL